MAHREREHTQLPIPHGWFAVAFSHELIRGDVKSIRCFGEDLVLFRARSGQARLLDAYCSHLGAHLGEGGRVVGENIRCPFHAWQYDGETGKCASIPYCNRIPQKAQVRAWPVTEKNGMIFAWYSDDASEPTWDFPVVPEIGDPKWSDPRTFSLEVPVHVQDMHENNNDPIHFHYVHGMADSEAPSDITYAANGREYRMVTKVERETPMGTFQTELIRDSYGIGLTLIRSVGLGDAGLTMFSSTTPIEPNLTISRWLLTATLDMIDLAGEDFMKALTQGVEQDLPIWSNKVHRANPVFCEADTYLAEYRAWTKQFYPNGYGTGNGGGKKANAAATTTDQEQ